MSRKSKLTLWKEELEKISDCPFEIFDNIVPDEEFFSLVESAEKSDVSALTELCERLFDVYKSMDDPNPALIYFVKRGIALESEKCAVIALKCIDCFNAHFDLLDGVCRILSGSDIDVSELTVMAGLKSVILSATSDADYNSLFNELKQIGGRGADIAHIYLASRMQSSVGSYDEDCTDRIADELGIPRVVTLPVFGGNKAEKECANQKKECEVLREALELLDMNEWRDFWLQVVYEYADKYLQMNLSPFAEAIADAIRARCSYPDKKLHVLALEGYMIDKCGKTDAEEYNRLYRECRFEGHRCDMSGEERDEIIKSAVYTSGKEEREKKQLLEKLGNVIVHTKNRYFLCATMENHQKRGNKHMWETRISIESPHKNPPDISISRITDRLNEASRCGVTLEREKKLSQVITRGEIKLHDKTSPFEMDLILDISYVSSTKCEYCEIKFKDQQRVGNYLVMTSVITIY